MDVERITLLSKTRSGGVSVSEQKVGLYFSCNANKLAHDHAIYIDAIDRATVVLGARYKNSERNHLYEMHMDKDDLQRFGQMCIDLAKSME